MSLQQMNDDDNKVVPLMDNEDESGRKSASGQDAKAFTCCQTCLQPALCSPAFMR